jgi:anionic cell wall polymer biosynthesis LytR-Cps2A-Psr (LCP) family protein
MILSVNPKKKTTELVSIPRDTQAEIIGTFISFSNDLTAMVGPP